MNSKKKKIMSCLLFLGIVFIMGSFFTGLFRRKSDGQTMRQFYAQPENSIDVIIMGSSLNAGAINTYCLGAETGTSVFNLSVSAQTTPVREYYLKEVLKTQKPKLIIMETYRYIAQPEMSVEEINYSAAGMRPSINKFQFLWNVPICEDGGERMELFVPLFAYHNRWAELTEEDWKGQGQVRYKYKRGDTSDHAAVVPQQPCMKPVKEIGSISEAQKEYLERIIQLAEENHIKLLFFNPPNAGTNEGNYKVYNALYEYLDSQGIDWLDCNYEREMMDKIDTSVDFVDSYHVNMSGGYKTTEFLADYINSHYELNGQFTRQSVEYREYFQAKCEELRTVENPIIYLLYLCDADYICYFDVSEDYTDETALKLISGIPHEKLTKEMTGYFKKTGDCYFKAVVTDKVSGEIVDVVSFPKEMPQSVVR